MGANLNFKYFTLGLTVGDSFHRLPLEHDPNHIYLAFKSEGTGRSHYSCESSTASYSQLSQHLRGAEPPKPTRQNGENFNPVSPVHGIGHHKDGRYRTPQPSDPSTHKTHCASSSSSSNEGNARKFYSPPGCSSATSMPASGKRGFDPKRL